MFINIITKNPQVCWAVLLRVMQQAECLEGGGVVAVMVAGEWGIVGVLGDHGVPIPGVLAAASVAVVGALDTTMIVYFSVLS